MKHLLVLSLGPVQEFIAAARRTQDLQAGSVLLVGLASAAAKAVRDAGAELIFPADPERDGANKILALTDSESPEKIAKAARAAAEAYLEGEWEDAAREVGRFIVPERAQRQVKTFLEFYAAWAPVDRPEGYAEARRLAERRLAGRKALRDFPPCEGEAGVHKSPLDPSRESVLNGRDGRVPPGAKTGPLWLKETEMLDAISLLKRWKGGRERANPTPSTSNMALRAILPQLRRVAADEIARLEALVSPAGEGLDLADLFLPTDALAPAVEPEVRRLRRAALRRIGRSETPPYYAILIADGDRMGKMLDACTSSTQHQAISRALTDFAQEARDIVGERQGYPVYCGGDDVVALLPVNQAIRCADELARAFAAKLTPVAVGEAKPTLSAGIAVVHCREPLQVSLERARAAEGEAKKERDSLAVALHTRGGSPITVAQTWGGGACRRSWEEWVQALRDGLARGAPYELAQLAREWEGTELSVDRLRAEAQRILQRKEGKATALGLLKTETIAGHQDLARLADRMIVARFLAGLEEGEGDV